MLVCRSTILLADSSNGKGDSKRVTSSLAGAAIEGEDGGIAPCLCPKPLTCNRLRPDQLA